MIPHTQKTKAKDKLMLNRRLLKIVKRNVNLIGVIYIILIFGSKVIVKILKSA